MIAFVLSGGGNRGPLEVGALGALLERGIRPDFLVGTSVGAINSAFVTAHGYSRDSLDRLEQLWRSVDARTVYPGNLFSVAWRVLRRADSLYSNQGVRRMVEEALPSGVTRFGDLQLPLFVPAADLLTNRLFMFGEDPDAPLVDAVLASASVPVIHPPVLYHGLQLVDGGILANVAASYAMDRGAGEIYAINVSSTEQEDDYAEGVVDVAFRSVNTMVVQALLRDLARARENKEIDLHHVYIGDYSETWFKDFSKTNEMFQAGYQAMVTYLDSPKPLSADADRPWSATVPATPLPGAREMPIPYP